MIYKLERFDRSEVTEPMLKQAAVLFNEHYGVWGSDPTKLQALPKPGERTGHAVYFVDADVTVTDYVDRQQGQDEPPAASSPVPSRRRRLPLRKGHGRR